MSLVFVSYSRINAEAVKQLVADLLAVGVDTWYDKDLGCGQDWWDSILSQIRACDLFIYALSHESWESEACKSELRYALELGKPILPVQVADGVNLNLLTGPLNRIQVADYRLRDKAATLALFKAINKSHAAPPLPDPLPAPPDVPKSYVIPLKERIDSDQPLTPDDQSLLFLKLEEAVEEGRAPMEIRELLLSLKKRDDLLARICSKIDALLKRLDEGHAVPPRNGDGNHETSGSGGLSRLPSHAMPKSCTRCGAQVAPGAVFCGACGNKLSMTGAPNIRVNDPGPSRQGWKSCRYICPTCDVPRVVTEVVGWLDAKGFDARQRNADSRGLLLQVDRRGEGRKLLGMATSLTVFFQQSDDTLTVEIGAGKWNDKVGAGVAGMFLFAPLAVSAGMGIWEQTKMPERIFEFIGTRLPYR